MGKEQLYRVVRNRSHQALVVELASYVINNNHHNNTRLFAVV